MKTKFALALVFAITLTFSSAFAQKGYKDDSYAQNDNRNHHKNPRYDHNDRWYDDDYKGGTYEYRRHGKLSRAEYNKLARQRRALEKEIYHARRNDGRISRSERMRIEREWRELNRKMYYYRNNDNRW